MMRGKLSNAYRLDQNTVLDAEHGVSGVSLVNLRFSGERLQTAQDAHLRLENHFHDVLLRD